MQKAHRRLATLVAVAGFLLLGYSMWYWFSGEMRFTLNGDWGPFITGVSGGVLLIAGMTAHAFYAHPREGLRRREQLRMIASRSGQSALEVLLVLVDYGGLGAAFCAAIVLMTSRLTGVAFLIWIAIGTGSYLAHRGAQRLDEWIDDMAAGNGGN